MADVPLSVLPAEAYLGHLDRESRRFNEVLAGVAPNIPVPTCPEWTAADLVWHLTEVQWFWGSIASGPILDAKEVERADADKPVRPEDYQELLALFGSSRERLAAAIADGPDDTPLWSWAEEQTLGFTRRRQAHEALIHRVDAELTAGIPVQPLDPALAADGVDEVLTVMWGDVPEWANIAPSDNVIAVETLDTGHAWLVRLGQFTGTSPSSGRSYDEPASELLEVGEAEPAAKVTGSASDLDQWLWNRGNRGITRSGSDTALDGLAALIAAGVQ